MKNKRFIKIKHTSHYISVIFILLFLSACSSNSSSSGGSDKSDSDKDNPPAELVTGAENVQTAINRAKKKVTTGATVTLFCQCDDSSIRGQGNTESSAKRQAQEKCTLLLGPSAVFSDCESVSSI